MTVDRTLVGDLVEDAAYFVVERGWPLDVALHHSVDRLGATKTDPPTDEEKAEALRLLRRAVHTNTKETA